MPSPQTNRHARCNESDEAAMGLLRQLARSGALAVKRADGICIERLADDARRCAGTDPIPPDMWALVLRKGWVVPHEDRDGWRISNAGRIALKRALSRSETSGPAVTVAAPAADAPRKESAVRQAASNAPAQNDCESPLHWLSRRRDRQGRRFISEAQLAAGDRLRSDFTFGSMMPSVTSRWSPVGGKTSRSSGSDSELELQDGQLRARERFRLALAAVGPEFSGILVDVCCHLKGLEDLERSAGWPQRSAKVVLLLALTALARHYGLIDASHASPWHDAERQCSVPSDRSPA